MKSFFKKPFFWLALILILAAFLRFYKIGQVPPSLNWDEVAIGYNAYSILKTGRDEWGRQFPFLGFESFGEYKLPVFVYASVPGVWLFGLNELGVRFMPALFGVLGVLVTYFLAKELFKNERLALLAAFILAVDIWHLQITRAAFEAGLAQLLISLSILLLLKSKKKWFFLPLSLLFACLSTYTYNSSRIFIPLFFSTAFLLNKKLFLSNKKGMILGGVVILFFVIPLILNFNKPVVKGRYQLISIQDDLGFVLRINRARGVLLNSEWPPVLARLVHNKLTHYLWIFGKNYISHFTPQFLFISGADHTQQSLPGFGQLIVVWLLPLLVGFYFLLKRVLKNKLFVVIFMQLLVAPVASSMTAISVPSALRIFCGLPAWQLIIAYGIWNSWQLIKKAKPQRKLDIQQVIFAVFLWAFLLNFGIYLRQYYIVYPRDYSKDWQYGYKKAVELMGNNKDRYDKLFLTRDYGEPYMFFLFYNRYPPQKYQSIPKVVVNRSGWLMVDHFDKYYFPDFTDPGNSILEITKKEKGKLLFVGIPGDIPQDWVVKRINYLNGEVAFEINSAEGKVK